MCGRPQRRTKRGLIPCLRQALEDPKADPWFRFDGSNLLVSLEPSESSKSLQVRSLANTNLEDVDLGVWVSTLAVRGYEGFDTSVAAERWLSYPTARYFLPQHGAYEVNVITGALFLFGSMDESFATPALLRIVNNSEHPSRELALAILLSQVTPESLQALKKIDISNLSSKSRTVVEKELKHPDLLEPRSKPKTTRPEFIEAFEALLKGNPRLFLDLVSKVPDGEKDVVATLSQDDLPLVRKVRRRLIAGGSPHMIEYYESFTKIIRTIMLKG